MQEVAVRRDRLIPAKEQLLNKKAMHAYMHTMVVVAATQVHVVD